MPIPCLSRAPRGARRRRRPSSTTATVGSLPTCGPTPRAATSSSGCGAPASRRCRVWPSQPACRPRSRAGAKAMMQLRARCRLMQPQSHTEHMRLLRTALWQIVSGPRPYFWRTLSGPARMQDATGVPHVRCLTCVLWRHTLGHVLRAGPRSCRPGGLGAACGEGAR